MQLFSSFFAVLLHSMARANLKKVNTSQLLLPQHQKQYPRGPESASIKIPPLNVNIVKQDLLNKKHFWKFYEVRSEIDADSGPLWYVLWCCGSRNWEVFIFFQIGSGHTVTELVSSNYLVQHKLIKSSVRPNSEQKMSTFFVGQLDEDGTLLKISSEIKLHLAAKYIMIKKPILCLQKIFMLNEVWPKLLCNVNILQFCVLLYSIAPSPFYYYLGNYCYEYAP